MNRSRAPCRSGSAWCSARPVVRVRRGRYRGPRAAEADACPVGEPERAAILLTSTTMAASPSRERARTASRNRLCPQGVRSQQQVDGDRDPEADRSRDRKHEAGAEDGGAEPDDADLEGGAVGDEDHRLAGVPAVGPEQPKPALLVQQEEVVEGQQRAGAARSGQEGRAGRRRPGGRVAAQRRSRRAPQRRSTPGRRRGRAARRRRAGPPGRRDPRSRRTRARGRGSGAASPPRRSPA